MATEPHPAARLLRIDFVAGLFVAAVAILIWSGSASLAQGELRNFGPGFLPRFFAVALLVCGLALVLRGLAQPPDAAERLVLDFRGPLLVGLAILLFALTIRGFALGPVQIPGLGLLLAGPLTVFLAGLGTVEARPRELVVLGFGLTGLMVLVFADLLGVLVPVFPAGMVEAMPLAWGQELPRRIAAVAWLAIAWGLWRLLGLSLAAIAGGGDRP